MPHDTVRLAGVITVANSASEADAWRELPDAMTDPGVVLEDVGALPEDMSLDHAALFIAETGQLDADRAQGLVWDADVDGEPLVEFTIVENAHQRLAKSYRADADGGMPVPNPAPRTSRGRFIRVLCRDVAAIVACPQSLTMRQAIMAGPLPGVVRQRRMIFHAQYQALPAGLRADAAGPLYRGSVFKYVSGRPGLLSIDVDLKNLPGWLRTMVALGWANDLCRLIASIDPGWSAALRIERGSSSTGIADTRTGAVLTGGRHIYTVAKDGADIPRYMRVLHDRLILVGLGYAFVDRAGGFEVRAVIDLIASGSPHWLIFEADAVLTDSCLRYAPGARQASWQDGALLDTAALADLTEAEQAKLTAIKTALRAKAAPEIRWRRLEHGAALLTSLQAAGLSAAAAERQVMQAAEAGLLAVRATYHFDVDPLDHGHHSYTDEQMLLLAPERFNGVTGADPLEPDYGGGRNKAIWYTHPGYRGLWCTSFAHGGRTWRMGFDAIDLIALWRASDAVSFEERLDLFARASQMFVSAEHTVAEALLVEAGLPPPAAFVMGLHATEKVTPAALLELVAQGDWTALATLAVGWRAIFAAAWEVAKQGSEAMHNWAQAEASLVAAVDKAKADADAERAAARPQLIMYSSETAKLADAGETALVAVKAEVYARGLVLVRPGHTTGRTHDRRAVNVPSLVIMDGNAAMREELSRVADWYLPPSGKRKTPRLDYPNELIAATLLQRRGRWVLPQCLGVLSAPTLRPDLSLLDTPGLDQVTHLYLSPRATADVRLWPWLDDPTADDARRGLELLKQLLIEVPFTDADRGVSRAIGLSGLISAVVRPAMPLVPLHAFDGPQQGQGKSFIVTIVSTVTTGLPCAVVTQREGDKAEIDKTLDTLLINGRSIIAIDNVIGELHSAKLSAALTESRVEVRFLGLNRSAEIDHTAMFFASGNRMKFSDDMGRRGLRGYLDNRLEYAMLRQYKYDPPAMIQADRGAYISAAIAIVRHYALAGFPNRLPRLASFGAWSDLVRSALVNLGEADPVGGMIKDIDTSPRRQTLRAIIAGILEAYPLDSRGISAAFTSKELVAKADENRELTLEGAGQRVVAAYPQLREALEGIADPLAARRHQSVGLWLANNADQTLDGVRILRLDTIQLGVARWQACRA